MDVKGFVSLLLAADVFLSETLACDVKPARDESGAGPAEGVEDVKLLIGQREAVRDGIPIGLHV